MLASYSEYMHKKAALEEYRAQYPDDADAIAKVQAALSAYETKNDVAPNDPGTAREVSALNAPTAGLPSQEQISQQLSHDSPAPVANRVSSLVDQLDPGFALPPQALATLPATTHPEGDKAAENEWVRGDLSNPNGRVIVYDAPLAKVRQDLAENPNLLDGLGLSVSPGARIEKGDHVEQGYQDWLWKKAADAAADGGKTAYRFSKAPYLGDGKNASILDTLSTKLKAGQAPAGEGVTAFVMGVDDLANFGGIRAAGENSGLGYGGVPSNAQRAEMGLPPVDPNDPKNQPTPLLASNDTTVGGAPKGESLRERDARIQEEHPTLYHAGQLTGAAPGLVGSAASKAVGLVSKAGAEAVEKGTKSLAEWSLSNGLWDAIMGTGEAAAKRGVVSGTARGLSAAGADQAIREGVQAGSNYAQTGDTGTTLKDAAEHTAIAAGGGAALHMLGGVGRKAASAVGEEVRWGPRYKGAPGRLETHEVPTGFFRGHIAPDVVKEAELRGRKEGGRDALTVLASDLDQPLGDVHRGRVEKAQQAEAATISAHRATPEAGYTLPARNLVETSVEKLRELTSPVPKKGLEGVAVPGSENKVKGIFNKNIEGVSTKATKNGVPLTVDEARSFLSPQWQEKIDLDKLAEKKGAQVWVTPRRLDSAHHDKTIALLSKSKDEHVQSLLEAARKDRAGRGAEYAAARDKHDAAIGGATAQAKSVGAIEADGKPKTDGVRDTVVRVGQSKGNDAATSALRSAATESGDKAREQLRGALVAEDLDALRHKASLGARNPLSSPWTLWGLTDKAMLRAGYPATKAIEGMAPGAAGTVSRLAAIPARAAMQSSKDKPSKPAPAKKRPTKRREPRVVSRAEE